MRHLDDALDGDRYERLPVRGSSAEIEPYDAGWRVFCPKADAAASLDNELRAQFFLQKPARRHIHAVCELARKYCPA